MNTISINEYVKLLARNYKVWTLKIGILVRLTDWQKLSEMLMICELDFNCFQTERFQFSALHNKMRISPQ